MIKNIVFDIGNVIVSFQPAQYFINHFHSKAESERVCTLVFAHEAWRLYDQGIVQMDDLKDIYKKEYPQEEEHIFYILNHWLELMQLMPETLTYMKELKQRGYKLYVLSNISGDSASYLKKTMPFFSLCDGEILSYKIKHNKPDIEIYNALLDTYAILPEETIFFDDNEANIEQAKKMGIHGIQFLHIKDAMNEAEDIIRR